MVMTIVEIGIPSRREGLEIREGHTVGFCGAGSTLFLDPQGVCKGISFINYLSDCICVL